MKYEPADSSWATTVVVLGAGPAGIASAYAMSKRKLGQIQVFESAPMVGGNSSSFMIDGIWCDFGSHRFHPVADPVVLTDVKRMLGPDLLLQPRHGRIRLSGRWIRFPLRMGNAMSHLPVSFFASLFVDSILKPFRSRSPGSQTFSSILHDGLGPTISNNFYFPYVKKLWGREPDELAVTLAERRVSGNSIGRIAGKILRFLPGLRSPTTGRFYYPKRGFGQIVETMADRAVAQGAQFNLNSKISRIGHENGRITEICFISNEAETSFRTNTILSTIPIPTLISLMDPPPPSKVSDAAKAIHYRGMILLYLVLETDRFTEYDAHYFPELSIPISRMSEPKNYNSASDPAGLTILCAELPCDPGDIWWGMDDEALGKKLCGWLGEVGLHVAVPIRRCHSRRLTHAYPVYDLKYSEHFEVMDAWLQGIDGLLNFGRQGLFAHDNTHHAFAMAYAAVECIDKNGKINREKWKNFRSEFKNHVVED
ncbi:NAD(P)/FAD-dependent oxidoreductase [Pseudoruegeria sp. SK021]|uniref:protoporphyrinogen/coproporphyrinogen oxidase n=1 Tax=Pseudoruegeria sp. SK021 TaxID=1933035 RepID=UPI000A22C131|nr:FAD-dependent oxidoreductase [Pseudoruegeria sp. SK021]OSP55306.1 hypothetical protein BV911_07660 [Pseudoruegeria sp. SK021]